MSFLKNKAIISGIGESRIGRHPGYSGLDLCAEASIKAVRDAGLKMSDIDALLTSYSTPEPYFVFYGVLAEYLGLQLDMGVTMTAGGGTPGMMLHSAVQAVASGQANNVLLVAGENRATGMGTNKTVQMLTAFGHPLYEDVYGIPIPGLYAMIAQRYLHQYGLDRSHLAPVAVQSRENALRTPNAHMTEPLSLQTVLDARPITEPLHRYDCCLISDGAGALVVSRSERAADLDQPAVHISGIGEYFTHEHLIAAPDLLHSGGAVSGRKAYDMAGIKPADVQFAELYDCFTITPVLLAEELGLAETGEGWRLWQDGHAAIDGRFPVNTHGGMLSFCHAGAAGGLLLVAEAAKQVRGTQADRQVANHDVGLAHVEGGIMSNHTTIILTNEKT